MPHHVLLTANACWNVLNFRRPIVVALLAAGHKVTVLAPFDGDEAGLRDLGCAVEDLAMDVKGTSPRRDLALMFAYRRAFARLRPDAVLGYTIKPNIYGALAAKSLGLPFLPNISGLGTAFLSGTFMQSLVEILYRRALRRLDTVFFQNADDRDLFVDRGLVRADQCHLLPGSGIDLEHFAPSDLPGETPVRFLMIARLIRDKGVVEYAEAARHLRLRGIPADCQFLGPMGVANRSAIDPDLLTRWQEEGLITYLGETTDVRPAIAAADCVVLPSYREGAPRVLIEAAAMGRPLVASDVPGCRDVVQDAQTGLLCAVRDGAALADAMARIIEMGPQARAQMGRAGRAYMAATYDQQKVVDLYVAQLAAAGLQI